MFGSMPPVKAVGAGSTFDKAAYTAYETVKLERDSLKESEAVYKRKVVALEEDAASLLKSYQGIYAENKILRSKVQHGPDAQKIKNYRSEIKRLEDKVTAMRSENELLKEEIFQLQKQLNITTDDKKRIDDAFKMEIGLHTDKLSNLEQERNTLDANVEKLERQCQEYEHRIKNYEEESDGLLSRYKELKRDNLKMESKFKKQKDLGDEELRDIKDTSKEMAKEIIQLKTKLARLEAEYHSVKLDYEAAKSQIDYQYKELDVFKTQSSMLKRNMKVTARDYNAVKEDLKTTENMLEDARAFGFEAVFEERKSLKRKERIHVKRIDDLEIQVGELSQENGALERELQESRRKMEAAIVEQQNLLYAENALKRRMEVLENANLELDRRSKFMFNTNKKGIVVTMNDENATHVAKEKSSLLAKVRYLETRNRKLLRKVQEFENENQDNDVDEDITLVSLRTRHHNKDRMIHAELPSLGDNDYRTPSYRRTFKPSRSCPSRRA